MNWLRPSKYTMPAGLPRPLLPAASALPCLRILRLALTLLDKIRHDCTIADSRGWPAVQQIQIHSRQRFKVYNVAKWKSCAWLNQLGATCHDSHFSSPPYRHSPPSIDTNVQQLPLDLTASYSSSLATAAAGEGWWCAKAERPNVHSACLLFTFSLCRWR